MSGVSPELLTLSNINIALPLLFVCGLIALKPFLTGLLRGWSIRREIYPVLLLLLLPFFSYLWTPDVLYLSAELGVYMVVWYFVFVALGLKGFDSRKFLSMLNIAMFIVCLFSLLLIYTAPSIGISQGGVWTGVYDLKNALGRAAGFGFISALILFFYSDPDKKFGQLKFGLKMAAYFAMSLYVLMMIKAQSGSSLMACVMVAGLVITLKSRTVAKRMYVVLPVSIVIAICSPLILILFDSILELVLTLLDRTHKVNSTVEVRLILWSQIMGDFDKHPWLGFGVGNYWGEGLLIDGTLSEWIIKQSHNGYIDLYFSFGALGVVLFTGFLFSVMKNVLKLKTNNTEMMAMVATFIYFLIINGFYSVLFLQLSLPWFVVCTCYCLMTYSRKRIVKQAN
ncbi:MAG: O-antigen ligase family protein [Gammaproteobacteria bacterium]|nr:O-antigen ligase family protein [Gammaproteobacteria bacterium]